MLLPPRGLAPARRAATAAAFSDSVAGVTVRLTVGVTDLEASIASLIRCCNVIRLLLRLLGGRASMREGQAAAELPPAM